MTNMDDQPDLGGGVRLWIWGCTRKNIGGVRLMKSGVRASSAFSPSSYRYSRVVGNIWTGDATMGLTPY